MKYYVNKHLPCAFPVKNGLALTPAMMDRMREQNIPISANLLSEDYFFDGTKDCSFDIPFEQMRGVDVAEIWEKTVKAKGRISKQLNLK